MNEYTSPNETTNTTVEKTKTREVELKATWNDVAKVIVVLTAIMGVFVGVVWAIVWGATQIWMLS